MDALIDLAGRVLGDVIATSARVWPFLLVSVVAAAVVSVYVGTERVSAMLRRRAFVATGGAVLLATLTPFCSCGTTAVLLGMLATAAPWAPLVAFMVASPLTSPSELVFSAGSSAGRSPSSSSSEPSSLDSAPVPSPVGSTRQAG